MVYICIYHKKEIVDKCLKMRAREPIADSIIIEL